jgi:hypothetical protein
LNDPEPGVIIQFGAEINKSYEVFIREYKFAQVLFQDFGKPVIMVAQRIRGKDYLPTPDYIWKGCEWEFKEITGNISTLDWHMRRVRKQSFDSFLIVNVLDRSPLFDQLPFETLKKLMVKRGIQKLFIYKNSAFFKEIAI